MSSKLLGGLLCIVALVILGIYFIQVYIPAVGADPLTHPNAIMNLTSGIWIGIVSGIIGTIGAFLLKSAK